MLSIMVTWKWPRWYTTYEMDHGVPGWLSWLNVPLSSSAQGRVFKPHVGPHTGCGASKKRWIMNLSSGIFTRVDNKGSCLLLHKCLETESSRFLWANWYLVEPWKVFWQFHFLRMTWSFSEILEQSVLLFRSFGWRGLLRLPRFLWMVTLRILFFLCRLFSQLKRPQKNWLPGPCQSIAHYLQRQKFYHFP